MFDGSLTLTLSFASLGVGVRFLKFISIVDSPLGTKWFVGLLPTLYNFGELNVAPSISIGSDSPISLFDGVPQDDLPRNEKYNNEPLLKAQSF